jgi:hypothetical protein
MLGKILDKIFTIFLHAKLLWRVLLLVIISLIGLWVAFNKQPLSKKKGNILGAAGEQKLISKEEFTIADTISNYERFFLDKQQGKDRNYGFDPRVKIIEGGGRPLRISQKKKQLEETIKEETPKKETQKNNLNKVVVKQKEQPKSEDDPWSGWDTQTFTKSASKQNQRLFKAIIRERQNIYDGKPVRIVLLESIPELSIPAGTTLKGPATFLDSARIKIHITKAEGSRERIDLDCFDSEDLQEGIFHDALAKQLQEYTQESIVDEILDIDFKGKRIAQKANNLTRMVKDISLEEGKEIFVTLTRKETKN